jgi:beta-carotene 3-hydroxylase
MLILLITLLTFAAMEGAAWAMHKYVLHGPLWVLHRSHHEPGHGPFERNDAVVLFYAALSAAACVAGGLWLGVGLGIALYGTIYFFVHDVLIHRRLRWFGKPVGEYLRAVDIAHKTHHATKGRDGARAFGMLWVAAPYRALARRRRAN